MNDLELQSDLLSSAGTSVLKIAVVLLIAVFAVRLGYALIEKFFRRAASKKPGARIEENRAKTLGGLLKSALRYTVLIVVLLMVLEIVGIDTKALMGGAAILGVAVGFGAQNLVRDVITGFFIIYEGQYDVGDYVVASGLSGIVEEVGLRTTRLRDWSGDVHVIPNGLVDKTTNRSRADSRVLFDVSIPHERDARRAMSVMQEACDSLARSNRKITQGPKVLGIVRFDASGIAISVWARTLPLEHWEVERDLRLLLKESLDKEGIRVTYPGMVIYQKTKEEDVNSGGTV